MQRVLNLESGGSSFYQAIDGATGALAQTKQLKWAHVYETSEPYHTESVPQITWSAPRPLISVPSSAAAKRASSAVEQFGRGSERLLTHLQRLDDTLTQSIARSDDQLAYYVAQAREVIELSLHAQKQVMDDLQRLANRQSALTEAAA